MNYLQVIEILSKMEQDMKIIKIEKQVVNYKRYLNNKKRYDN